EPCRSLTDHPVAEAKCLKDLHLHLGSALGSSRIMHSGEHAVRTRNDLGRRNAPLVPNLAIDALEKAGDSFPPVVGCAVRYLGRLLKDTFWVEQLHRGMSHKVAATLDDALDLLASGVHTAHDLHILPRHRLLLQSHGFEGSGVVIEE